MIFPIYYVFSLVFGICYLYFQVTYIPKNMVGFLLLFLKNVEFFSNLYLY